MKTIRLDDEGFEVIAAALEAQGDGMEVLIEFLSGRYGPQSDQVKTEEQKLARLTAAALDFHGISAWRNNGAKTMPAESRFQLPRGHA